MKRILLKSFAAMVCLLCSITVSAESFEVDGINYNLTSETEKTVEVTYGANYYTGSMVIPETVTYSGTKYSVTSIGDYAFLRCTGLTSVTIPNSVISIGMSAFSGCTGLTTVNFYAKNCSSMGSDDLPVFWGCTNLTTLNIGASVENIPHYAFSGCTGLTSITIPENVKFVGKAAFQGCNNLVSIEWNAIEGYIDFEVRFNQIINFAFEDCRKNITEFTLGNKVSVIPPILCLGMKKLSSITIPNSATSIGDYAFSGCTGLTEFAIGSSVTSIGDYAFSGCTGLTSITIPEIVAQMGVFPFENCNNLTRVEWNAIDCKIYEEASSVYVPFQNSVTEFTFGDKVSSIPTALCCGLDKLSSITIPNSVTSIGRYAFAYCNGLESVVIPENVALIGQHVFYNCENLTHIEWNAISCENLYKDTPFCGTTKISDFIFGNKVERIPTHLCCGMEKLPNIIFPHSITSIGDYAFRGCVFEEIIIPDNVETIGINAFEDCSNLRIVTLGSGLREIGDYAFRGCVFEEIIIPDNVETIGINAFEECSNLRIVTLGSGLREIGDYAFSGCDRIKYVYEYQSEPPIIYSNTFTPYVNDNATLYVYETFIEDYLKAPYWKYFSNVEGLSSRINDISSQRDICISVIEGLLTIAGATDDAVVNIYNTNGSLLHHTTVSGVADIALHNGIYFVQVNGVTQKVAL